MTNKLQKDNNQHGAIAKSLNLSISTKHSVEISRNIRYKSTSDARQLLEDVVDMKRALPFRKYKKDMGHKRGMMAGRYPQKATKEFLKLIKSVEANAQSKGLDTGNLKITKIISNQASIPFTGGRRRTGTKRTHIEIEVKEFIKRKSAGKTKKADVKEGSKIKKTTSVRRSEGKSTDHETKLQEGAKQ